MEGDKKLKERPILFSASMVQAILAGRKGQTRRPIKPQPANKDWVPGITLIGWQAWPKNDPCAGNYWTIGGNGQCPYGQVGDRLWVREPFVLENTYEYHGDHEVPNDGRPIKKYDDPDYGSFWLIPHYRATEPEPHIMSLNDPNRDEFDDRTRWKPSIQMPRWASRLLLEVTKVRVERVQDISEEDAKAEGAPLPHNAVTMYDGIYRDHFMLLWNSIYGDEAWERNDWAWVIGFKQLDK